MPVTPGNSTSNNSSGAQSNIAAGATTPTGTTSIVTPPSLQTTLGNTTPPPMQTLVYSPDVRILIAHNGLQYEVSNDLVRGTLIRKENSASTLLFSCHNKGLRYTNGSAGRPLFSRMDRITCYMKRAGTWVQTFSGYLDSVPYLQLYPGIVNFKATCTLKRLLCNWWNPGLPQSADILNQYNTLTQGTAGDGQLPKDSGMGSMLRDLLVKVGGWDPSTVHIQNFPSGFMDLLQSQLQQQQQNQTQGDNFRKLLEGDVSTPAPGAMAGYNGSAGAPGVYGAGQQFYVQEIVAAADTCGCGPTVTDLNISSGLQQAATAGEKSQDSATQQAFQQVQQVAKGYNTSTRNQDGAILGVATSMVETNLRNLANPGVPESMNYQNDGTGTDNDSVGLFQQRSGWGTVSQRMNPRQSAMMFFQHLTQYDWRNMDPGTACWDVQRAADPVGYAAKIDAAIPQAQQLVSQIRGSTGSGSTKSTPLQSPTTLLASSGSGGLLNGAVGPGQATNPPTSTPVTPATSRVGKPSPDSEGAINWMMTQLGKPYVYGADGPDAFDCSSLMENGFRAIGLDIGRDTYTQAAKGQRIAPSNIQRGDTLQCEGGGHTMMWCGDGTIIEAATEGVPIHRRPAYVQPAQASGIFRFCDNGGPDPTAPFSPPATVGPGNPPYTGQSSVAGAAAQTGEPIAQNLFAYIFTPDQFLSDLAMMYSSATPEKDFIDAQPLIQMVQSIAGACLRNFASAPNGDFIAYYPDFFGMDGKPAVFILEDIELKDCTLNFSDDALTTHVYVNGSFTPTGEVDQELGWLTTMGYATVENQQLYQRMRLVAPGDLESLDGQELMKRFGVRPLQVTYGTVWSPALQFLLAVRIFMEKWAAQYQSSIAMTFMPDLFPGMRVQLSNHNIQFYVNEVTQHFDFEQGFDTEAVVTAPSNPNVRALWPGSDQPAPLVSAGPQGNVAPGTL